MTKPKTQRNELIIDLYNQGKTNRQILAGLLEKGFDDYQKVKSVTMQISRLRKAGKLPLKRPVTNKITTPQKSKVTKLQKDKVQKHIKLQSDQKGSGKKFLPVSYRLSEDMKWNIKRLAAEQRKDVSQLVREILQKYINEQNDK